MLKEVDVVLTVILRSNNSDSLFGSCYFVAKPSRHHSSKEINEKEVITTIHLDRFIIKVKSRIKLINKKKS